MEGSKCKSGQKIRSNIGINLQCQGGSLQISLGMATGQVWARFLHTWTRPVGPNLRPGPSLIIKRIFFANLDLPRKVLFSLTRNSESKSRNSNPLSTPSLPILTHIYICPFLKQAPNSTSNPQLNNQSQKSILFKSPQPHLNK